MAEKGLSARVMRRYHILETQGYYIYIIYTPNLGFAIAILGREKEQGHFRGNKEGAKGVAREY